MSGYISSQLHAPFRDWFDNGQLLTDTNTSSLK